MAVALTLTSGGCGDPCARVVQRDPDAAAEICEKHFRETGHVQSGLAALKAQANAKNVKGAEALAVRLDGTKVSPDVSLVMGELYESTRDPRAAPTLARAVERLAAVGDHARASHAARTQTRAAWRASRYQEALTALDRALAEADRAKDSTLAGKAYLSLFSILFELGDLNGARRALTEATAREKFLEPAMTNLIGFNRGLLASAEDNPKSARIAFEAVLRSPATKPTSDVAWNARLNLLAMAIEAGDRATAEREWTAAKPIFEGGGFSARPASRMIFTLRSAQLARLQGAPDKVLSLTDTASADQPAPGWQWLLQLERGRALSALGRLDDAKGAYTAAASIVEGLRGEQFDDFKSWVVAQRRAPYVALFALHAQRGDAVAATEIFERTQGRTFLEAFAAAAQPNPGDKGSGAASRVDHLKRLYPALRRSAVIPATATPIAELLPQLSNDHVVGFFETEDPLHEGQLHVIVVAGGKPRLAVAGLSLRDVRALVTKMLANPADGEVAAALGTGLFPEGTLPDGKGTTKVHLIPSPSLAGLPFASLTRAGKYLAAQWILAEVPSLSALVALRSLPHTATTPPAVFADPAGDLSAARAEAKEVGEGLGDDTRVFVGADVTSERLRDVGAPAVLHFALHSGLGPAGAWLGLADRQIFAGELVEWRLRAHLVVLASCASVATRDPGQWGSLAASFLANGTPSVVGSLWSTKDEVNRAFVRRFYAEGGAADPALGLAAAQRAWIAEGRSPADWGAYVVYGAVGTAAPDRLATIPPSSRQPSDGSTGDSKSRSFPHSSNGSSRGSSQGSSAFGRRGP